MLLLFTSVTYETQCHAIGQQEFYRDCCGLKKEFYNLHSSLLLYHNLPAASTSSLKSAGLHTAVEDAAPARVFLWITQQSTNIMFSTKLYLRISNMLKTYLFFFSRFSFTNIHDSPRGRLFLYILFATFTRLTDNSQEFTAESLPLHKAAIALKRRTFSSRV